MAAEVCSLPPDVPPDVETALGNPPSPGALEAGVSGFLDWQNSHPESCVKKVIF